MIFKINKTTAKGFAEITTFSLAQYLRLVTILIVHYGFRLKGEYIPPVTDESIYPSLVCRQISILTGWNRWFGYYLLADAEATDAFCRSPA